MFNPGRRSTTDGPTTRQLLVSSDQPGCLPRRTPAMAISSALRRCEPWAAAAARGLLASRSVWRVHPPQTHPHRAECSALLSSLSAPQPGAAADAQLLRVINYEISCAQQDCKKRDWVCDPAISLFSSRSLRFSHTVSDQIHK